MLRGAGMYYEWIIILVFKMNERVECVNKQIVTQCHNDIMLCLCYYLRMPMANSYLVQ